MIDLFGAHIHLDLFWWPASSEWSAFWQGFGSALSEFAIIGTVIIALRRMNCGVKGCWRLSHHKYKIGEVEHALCRSHRPHVDHVLTAQDVIDYHNRPKETP